MTEDAYIEGPTENPNFTACAINPDEGVDEDGLYTVYEIIWYPTEEWLASDQEDEGWACDWDQPDEVERRSYGYNLDENRIV